MSDKAAAMKLQDLRDEMLEKLDEMESLVREAGVGMTYDRAKSYWIPHVKMALTKDHGYLGGSMVDCEDTINEMYEDEEEYED